MARSRRTRGRTRETSRVPMRPRNVSSALALVALLLAAPATCQEGQSRPRDGQDSVTYRLTLGGAARLAAERATPVLQARARTESALARVGVSTADLLPTVNADVYTGGRTFNTASFGLDFPTAPGQPPFFDPDGEVVGPVKSADVRARAEIALLDMGALGRRRSAQAAAFAAQREESSVADAAAAVATRAYVGALRAAEEVATREEDLRLAEELVGIARGLLESGVGVAIDVTRAEAQVATIRAQLLAAEHRARTTQLSLRRTLALSDDAAMDLVDDLSLLPFGETPSEDNAISLALERRTDLRTAEAHESAAREAVSATRAGRLPRLSVSVDDGFYGRRFDHVLNTYTWTVRASLPLFDGFERSSRLREQNAQVLEVTYRIDALRDDIVFEVRRALLDLDAAVEQAAAAEERLRLAELEVSQEEERVRAGVAGTADLVRAAMRLNEARTARLDVLTAVHTARVGLATAMGTVRELP
jgi:outer membrane protein